MRQIAIAPVLLAGLLAGPLACTPDTTQGSLQVEVDDGCPSWGCGSNTPRVPGAPIEALHLGGEPNDQGVRLIPDSLRGEGEHPCNESATLDVRGGELVGLTADGQVACAGMELVDARFDLAIAGVGQVTIWIQEMGYVHTWQRELPRESLATYRMVEAKTEAPICPRAEAWMEGWQDFALDPDLAPTWLTSTHHAILVRGETYDGTDATVDHWGAKGADWFNIACAGTAIAKMRLLGYDPLDASSSPKERQATLKMITAKYCGTDSLTEHGMPVRWTSGAGTPYFGTPDPARVGEIESRWDEHGAICVSHARAWRANLPIPRVIVNYCLRAKCTRESSLIDRIQVSCGIPACTGAAPAIWTTHTVDHVAH